MWRVVAAWLDPDRDVENRSSVQGCLTDAENQQFNSELMDQSQNDAKYVALDAGLGYTVPANPVQIRIVEVCRDAPAHGVLETGDQVLAVDGTDVTDVAADRDAVQAHNPGDRVTITYDRNGVTRTASITAGKVTPRAVARADAVLRARARDRPRDRPASGCRRRSSSPINSRSTSRSTRSSSADRRPGLAFTLAIIDDLTPGSLTGGKQVAVTGTIAPDGTVGEVGGVEQKAITARTNGVQLMIVPKSEVRTLGAGRAMCASWA